MSRQLASAECCFSDLGMRINFQVIKKWDKFNNICTRKCLFRPNRSAKQAFSLRGDISQAKSPTRLMLILWKKFIKQIISLEFQYLIFFEGEGHWIALINLIKSFFFNLYNFISLFFFFSKRLFSFSKQIPKMELSLKISVNKI